MQPQHVTIEVTGRHHVLNVEGDVVDRSQHSGGDFDAEIDRIRGALGSQLSHGVFLNYTILPEVVFTLSSPYTKEKNWFTLPYPC